MMLGRAKKYNLMNGKNGNLYKQRKTNKQFTWHKNILNIEFTLF